MDKRIDTCMLRESNCPMVENMIAGDTHFTFHC